MLDLTQLKKDVFRLDAKVHRDRAQWIFVAYSVFLRDIIPALVKEVELLRAVIATPPVAVRRKRGQKN